MTGTLALYSEIIAGLHQTSSEEHLPQTVHGDTGRERVVFRYDPFSERESVRGGARGKCRETGRSARRDLPFFLVIRPARENERLPHGRLIAHHHHFGKGRARRIAALFGLSDLAEPLHVLGFFVLVVFSEFVVILVGAVVRAFAKCRFNQLRQRGFVLAVLVLHHPGFAEFRLDRDDLLHEFVVSGLRVFSLFLLLG
ncbi:unnamed protein product [Gemmata massiliana]|uniref:Uncharacterized protein n=1 Tax=Gemmata massiliana TaxID=1210884 RepID=A0A6P2CUT3_9BACT|nr:unnamed protein product [Gemmata massiliana]